MGDRRHRPGLGYRVPRLDRRKRGAPFHPRGSRRRPRRAPVDDGRLSRDPRLFDVARRIVGRHLRSQEVVRLGPGRVRGRIRAVRAGTVDRDAHRRAGVARRCRRDARAGQPCDHPSELRPGGPGSSDRRVVGTLGSDHCDRAVPGRLDGRCDLVASRVLHQSPDRCRRDPDRHPTRAGVLRRDRRAQGRRTRRRSSPAQASAAFCTR